MQHRFTAFTLLLIVSWLAMTLTHELGHVVGGWAGGATLVDYDLVPWRMSYSLHSPDPVPLLTLWAGPILGVLIPALLALAARQRWAWFIADFCLVANGGYLALAWISGDRHLDTPRLLDAGADPATIALYCAATIGLGYVRFRSDCVHYLHSSKPPNKHAAGAGAER